jgi:hypothetical protein
VVSLKEKTEVANLVQVYFWADPIRYRTVTMGVAVGSYDDICL